MKRTWERVNNTMQPCASPAFTFKSDCSHFRSVTEKATRSVPVNLCPWFLKKYSSGCYSKTRTVCVITNAFTQWGRFLKGTARTQKNIFLFYFLFSDPLCYLSGLHQISWHTISVWEAGPSSILNSALFSRLIDGCKHTAALIAPLQLRPPL